MRIYLNEKVFLAEDGNLFREGFFFPVPFPLEFNQLTLKQLKALSKTLNVCKENLSLPQAERYSEINSLVSEIEKLVEGAEQ